ncbi:MAG: TonB-dependent receptor [Pseudomonadota bacterium]
MKLRIAFALILAGAIAALAGPAALGADPAAVKLSLQAGASLESVLAALNARGFRVLYSSALVKPDMTLQAAPASTHIDALLREILAPWKLHADHAANGDWLIVADSPAQTRTQLPEPAAYEDIESIDVTASRLRLATAGVSQTFLDREDVQRLPHLGDDALRMLKILPGVSGGDISAAMNIRGGRRDEALLSIDGAEIHNGFHFRDIDGAFSVLDTNLVQGVEFTTGGVTAEYGDYMSGVVGLQSRRPLPDDEYHHQFGISFVSAFGSSSGTFADGRGSWLASARRGFLDVLTAQVEEGDEQLTPRYTDVFGSLNFDFSERTRFAARLMMSEDDLTFRISDATHVVDSSGKSYSTHLWATLDHDWSDSLHMNSMVSLAQMNQARDSFGSDEHRDSTVRSDNDFSFLDLRQDWSWALSERNLPRWGFNVARQRGDYDYALDSTLVDPLLTPVPVNTAYATRKRVDADKLGVYASWRTRIVDSLTAEAGARWDSYGYSDGLDFDVVSPRLNLVYQVNSASELRAAWSVVYQPQGVHELQVEDNVSQFFRPERSEQFALGFVRRLGSGLSLRVDLYRKTYEHLRPYFDNLLGSIQLIPEAGTDRVRVDAPTAQAKGVEATLRREASRGIAGWVSFTIASVEEREDNRWVPRGWDQRTTVTFGSSWTGQKWNLSLAGVFHDGTPITYFGIDAVPAPGGGSDVVGVVGPRNGDRLGPYTRIDLRANREVRLANSKLSFYLEVTNLLNTKNQSGFEDYGLEQDSQGNPVFWRKKDYWLPLLPSFGFQYEF